MNARQPLWLSLLLVLALVLPLGIEAAPVFATGDDQRGGDRRAAEVADDDRGDRNRADARGEPSRRDGSGQERRNDDRDRSASPAANRGGNRASGAAEERQKVEGQRRKKKKRPPTLARPGADSLRCAIEDDDDDENTPPDYDDGYCADQVVVQLRPNASIGTVNSRFGTRTIASINNRALHLLSLPSNGTGQNDEEDFAGRLQGDGGVEWAELNYTGQAPEGRPGRFFSRGEATPGTPGDSYVPNLIGIPAANECATGQGQTVAVIDSGIDAGHRVFDGRLATPWNAFTGDGRATADVGDNLDNDKDRMTDEMVGHGTHVAGIVAQIAPGARILPIKALDSDGLGEAFYLARAIYHAVDSGADVINLSLGSTEESRVVEDAIAAATGAGVVVAAAAGNLGEQRLDFPAAYEVTVSVAATDRGDVKATFSSYEGKVDLSAPGVEIVSAFPGGGYRSWDGTSMATPWTAGAAAVVLSDGGSAADAEQRLRQTADDIDRINPDYQGKLGAGRLDIGQAANCGR